MSSAEEVPLAQEVALLAERYRNLADTILDEDAADLMSDEALQQLMSATVKLYVAKLESGAHLAPFTERDITATEVAITATEMLKAVEMEVFELGMWQVWGSS